MKKLFNKEMIKEYTNKFNNIVDKTKRLNFLQSHIKDFTTKELLDLYHGELNNIKSTKAEKVVAKIELVKRNQLQNQSNVWNVKVKPKQPKWKSITKNDRYGILDIK